MTEPTMATRISARNRMPIGRHWDLMNLKYSLGPPPPRLNPEVTRAQTT